MKRSSISIGKNTIRFTGSAANEAFKDLTEPAAESRIPRPDIINLAEQMYSAYCTAVGGKAFNGDPLPDWKTFAADPRKVKQRDAWIAAANAARNFLTGPQ